MTIDDGSSRSQSEVHLEVFKNLVAADADFIRDLINDQLLRKMEAHGFPVAGLRFAWDDGVDYTPDQMRNIEQMILNQYEVDPQYFIDRYNITLPESDPFWDSYYPPNGWGCRCTVVQVRIGKYERSDSDDAIRRGNAATAEPKQKIFRFNPGNTMKVMPPKHPYYPKGCGNCDFKKFSYDSLNPECQACQAIAKCMNIFKFPQAEAYKQILDWGRNNIIGKYTYKNAAFGGREAIFDRNSFTENLSKGRLLYAKGDVLTHIKQYLTDNLQVTLEATEHGDARLFYTAIVE